MQSSIANASYWRKCSQAQMPPHYACKQGRVQSTEVFEHVLMQLRRFMLILPHSYGQSIF